MSWTRNLKPFESFQLIHKAKIKKSSHPNSCSEQIPHEIPQRVSKLKTIYIWWEISFKSSLKGQTQLQTSTNARKQKAIQNK